MVSVNGVLVRYVKEVIGLTHNVILKAPTHVELTITEKCNHKCKHCYNSWRDDIAKQESLSIDKREYIINELIENQITYVTLTGGEPLMEQDSLFWFIEKFKKNNIGIGLNTNLSLMNRDIANTLVNKYNWGNTILTSLPGFNEYECDDITQISGSFSNIERGIDICIENKIDVGVNVVVTKNNVDKLEELYDFLDKHRISVLALTRVVPPVYNCNDKTFLLDRIDINKIAAFLKIVKKKYGIRVTSLCSLPFCLIDDVETVDLLSTKCAAGIIGCCINAISGEITPCAHNEKSYGNVYKDGLQSAWNNMSSWREGNYIPSECQKCNMLSACGGDCRLNSNRVEKKPYSLDGSCMIRLSNDQMIHRYDKEKNYSFNNKTIFREEAFGAVVSLGVNEFYITTPVYKVLCILRDLGTFDNSDLEKYIVVNDFFEDQLTCWINAEIIYEINK